MFRSAMKKSIFLASLIAAVSFASEASALPLFARQTGMECAACHFQHFPMLTAFGRAFKAGAYTLTGAQDKVEGDNLSIPAVLNAAILTTAGYTKSNADSASSASVGLGARNGDLTMRIYSLGFLAFELISENGSIKSSRPLDNNKRVILTYGLRDCVFWWDMGDFEIEEQGK